MKIELWLKVLRNKRVEVSRTIYADNLSQLPMPIPAIGEHLMLEVDGAIHCGLVNQKEIDLTEIEESEGVLKINIFADEQPS
jgi:hypothetical protein